MWLHESFGSRYVVLGQVWAASGARYEGERISFDYGYGEHAVITPAPAQAVAAGRTVYHGQTEAHDLRVTVKGEGVHRRDGRRGLRGHSKGGARRQGVPGLRKKLEMVGHDA